MGGCASKPQELNGQNPVELPPEGSTVPDVKPVEGVAPPTEVEEKKDEPLLVDLSDHKPEEEEEPKPSELKADDLAPGISELKSEAPAEAKMDADEEKENAPPVVDPAPAEPAKTEVAEEVVPEKVVSEKPANEEKKE